jgi:hypothetical protein
MKEIMPPDKKIQQRFMARKLKSRTLQRKQQIYEKNLFTGNLEYDGSLDHFSGEFNGELGEIQPTLDVSSLPTAAPSVAAFQTAKQKQQKWLKSYGKSHEPSDVHLAFTKWNEETDIVHNLHKTLNDHPEGGHSPTHHWNLVNSKYQGKMWQKKVR